MLTAETPFQQVIDIYSAITCVSVLFLVRICILLYSYMAGFARFRLLKRFGGGIKTVKLCINLSNQVEQGNRGIQSSGENGVGGSEN